MTAFSIVALTEVFPDAVLPWRSRAACRTPQSEVFYPMGTRPLEADIDAAKQVCRRCPVVDDCLDAADDFGIWGGFTAAERRRLDLL
jgi:WhiB family redox-sensing transcriptional regulator